MNWIYGAKSSARRDTCTPNLIRVMNHGLARSPVDITIVHGWRGEEVQNALQESGASKKRWPDSKHNRMENGQPWSEAFDFAPWVNGDIPWDDTHLFCVVAGVFFASAIELGVKVRWGGDWDMDGLTTDQKFMDWGHIEEVME